MCFPDAWQGSIVERCENDPLALYDALHQAGGLLVLKGLGELSPDPRLLARLSRLFGPEVEDYHLTLTSKRFLQDQVREVLLLSNLPPCNHLPPARPEPGFMGTGELPVQFPHRRGWHTDQSYRRPPPDISLLYAVACPPRDQGQTLYADCTAAYQALAPGLQRRVASLNGIHAPSWIGRTAQAVRAGEAPKPLLAHQLPQLQPLVRVHPVTAKRSLYLCEDGQMDFVDGPIAGLAPGPDGEGAKLLYKLLSHCTQACFTYTHHWTPGDLLINDNRCLLHAPTWYDAEQHPRIMWRTTVLGNAGKEYQGESKSWISKEGYYPMHGMEDS